MLAVHPAPLGRPAGEVEVTLGVDVAEVTAPVPTTARGPGVGLGVVVVPLEGTGACRAHDLPDALLGVREPAGGVEAGRREEAAVLVDDLHRIAHPAHRPWRHPRLAVDGHTPLGRAEGVHHLDAEAGAEGVHHLRRSFVTERDPQGVVGVVGSGGRVEDVGERLAGVVEVRRSVAAHVVEPARGAEPSGQAYRSPVDDRRCPADHDGVGMEQRHAHVPHVVGPEPQHDPHAVAGHHDPSLGADHGLRRVGCPRGEDQRPDRVRRRIVDTRVPVTGVGECLLEGATDPGLGVPRAGEAARHPEVALGHVELVDDRLQQGLVSGLGHDHGHVGVGDVATQLFAAARGIDADDRRSAQRRASDA